MEGLNKKWNNGIVRWHKECAKREGTMRRCCLIKRIWPLVQNKDIVSFLRPEGDLTDIVRIDERLSGLMMVTNDSVSNILTLDDDYIQPMLGERRLVVIMRDTCSEEDVERGSPSKTRTSGECSQGQRSLG